MVKKRSIQQRKFNSTTKQKKRRAGNNKARRLMKAAGVNVKGKDVNHKDGNPRNNGRSNLNVESPSKNRARKPKRRKS